MKTDITMTVRYLCGCTETIRTSIDIPADLANAERTPDTDREIIRYIGEHYDLEKLHCGKRHRFYPGNFQKIIEIQ